MAQGALLDPAAAKCCDEWLVKHVGEDPYLQFFIGMKEYGPCPFGASTLVAFRKRFSEADMAAILEASVPKQKNKEDPNDEEEDPPNSGTLILDATCCPADIAYPQDVDLLDQAREKVKKLWMSCASKPGRRSPGCIANVPEKIIFTCPKAKNAPRKRFIPQSVSNCNTSAGT